MEALGRLAAGIAHDFNNFLFVIQASCELAESQASTNETILQELTQIQSSTQRAAELTKQLLAFSHRQIVSKAWHQPEKLLREIEPLLLRLLGKAIELRTDIQSDLGRIYASSAQVEQILFNLSSNARDAMPAGGNVTLALLEKNLDDGEVRELPPGRYLLIQVRELPFRSTCPFVQQHPRLKNSKKSRVERYLYSLG